MSNRELTDDFEVIQVQVSEAETVIEILKDAANWLRSRDINTWDPDEFEPIIFPGIERGDVYLAKLNGQPVGTFILQWEDPDFWGERPDDAGYLHKVAVARSAAGQNIGTRIVKAAEKLVRAKGRPYLRLDCQRDNPKINQFYRQFGFEFRGTGRTRVVDVNLYEKYLGNE